LDESLWERDGFEPRLAWFDPDAQTLWPVDGQSLDGRVLTATVDHFSIYVVLDAAAFDKVEHPVVIPPSTGAKALDVVFVNDVSGSMTTSDRTGQRAVAIRALMEGLVKGDRAGLVSFQTGAQVREPLTGDWMGLLTALGGLYDGGGTCGTCGLAAGLGLFGDRPVAQARRVVVFLTDGEDTTYSGTYDQLIAQAKQEDVVVHTIGLGPGVDSALLKRIALETGGAHQAGGAGDLVTYYTDIQEASDPTDSNNDGITDYYTRLMTDRGLYAGTGARVFGKATYEQVQANSDLDQDGIKNGDEIDFSTVLQRDTGGFELVPRVYVKLKSSPISTDSDGDGYGDYTENTWPKANGGPHDPMASDVRHYTLSNADYVPVGLSAQDVGNLPANQKDLGIASYGGNQDWYPYFNIDGAGCGIIAMVDLVAYLGASNPLYPQLAGPIRAQPGFNSFSPLSRQNHEALVLRWTPDRFVFPNAYGLAFFEFEGLVNQYAREAGAARDPLVTGTWRPSRDDARRAVRRNIGADLPVPVLHSGAGSDFGYYEEAATHVIGADRRVDRNRDGSARADDYPGTWPPGQRGDDYFSLAGNPKTFDTHYVVLTEYIEDGFDGRTKVVFSSWGRKMVADWEDVRFGVLGGMWDVH
jgi:hypothetical protein